MDDALRIDADRDQLFRVLSNLVPQRPAGASSSRTAPGATSASSARRDGQRVTIEVRDDGPGVPEKARAHLFQAFQGSARKGGTGLGPGGRRRSWSPPTAAASGCATPTRAPRSRSRSRTATPDAA